MIYRTRLVDPEGDALLLGWLAGVGYQAGDRKALVTTTTSVSTCRCR
jgi:hypothetical protein